MVFAEKERKWKSCWALGIFLFGVKHGDSLPCHSCVYLAKYSHNVAKIERGVSGCFCIISFWWSQGKETPPCSSPLMHLRRRILRDFARANFSKGLHLSENIACSKWLERWKKDEWILIICHQIEKERFEYRSVNFQGQYDDPISIAKHEAIFYVSILFEHGTTDQPLAKTERG